MITIDLTRYDSAQTNAIKHVQCSICFENTVVPSHNAQDSIQCNCGYDIFPTAFSPLKLSVIRSRCPHEGCKQWFHKRCLKPWHQRSVENGTETRCPICRSTNSFIWSYMDDEMLSKCLFREDFMQHAVMHGNWDVKELKKQINEHNLSVLYQNDSRSIWIPNWVFCNRNSGSLMANAVRAGDYLTVKYLAEEGAMLPDLTLPTTTSTTGNTLLMIAAKAYSSVRRYESPEMQKIFFYLVDQWDCTKADLRVETMYPYREDVLLYVIRNEHSDLLRMLLPSMLRKHKAHVLLHWALKTRRSTFITIVCAMQSQFSRVKLEHALVKCALAGCASEPDVLDMIWSVVPNNARQRFFLDLIGMGAQMDEPERLVYLLYHFNIDFAKLTTRQTNELLIKVSLLFGSTWSLRFDFENGYSLVSEKWTKPQFSSFMSRMLGDMTATKLLKQRDTPITDISVQTKLDSVKFNVVELVLMKLRVLSQDSTTEVVHQLLRRAVVALAEVIQSCSLTATMVRKYMKRVLHPIVAYLPACLHENTTKQNVLLYCAEKGLHSINRTVFKDYHPCYNVLNADGQNCLHLALKHGQYETAKYMLTELQGVQKGSLRLDLVDSNKQTLLMACAIYFHTAYPPSRLRSRKRRKVRRNLGQMEHIAKLLLQREASQETLGLQDLEGNTALHYAYISKNTTLVALFKQHMTAAQIALENNEGLQASSFK